MALESTIRSIGVIGTPGCGKTTLCKSLGLPVISLRDFAEQNGCLGEVETDGALAPTLYFYMKSADVSVPAATSSRT